MDISVFGLGHVGTVSAVSLSRLGHRVIGVDVDERKVAQINRGVPPVVEPGVTALLQQARKEDRLSATTDAAAAIHDTDLSLICVGTPSQPDGSLNADHVMRVAAGIGEALRTKRGYHGVVIRSTAIPGTADRAAELIASRSGKKPAADFGVAVNPEFMRAGSSIEDFQTPPYTVVGTADARVAALLADVYDGIAAPFYRIRTREAEMLKYACNAFHAVKVTFANEIGTICKRLGIDSHKVMSILVEDTNLNTSSAYLRPGFAFGGSCLPKDLRAIVHEAERLDLSVPMLSAVSVSNNEQVDRVVARVVAEKRNRIGVLGLSFKSGTDDLRESPMVSVVKALIDKGCDIAVYDPSISLSRLVGANKSYIEHEIPDLSLLMRSSMQEVLDHADVVLIGNKRPGFREALDQLRPGQRVYDLVRIVNDEPPLVDGYEGISW